MEHEIKLITVASLLSLLMALAVLMGGCTSIQREYERQRDKWRQGSEVPQTWRRDLATVQASNNSLKFWTRNLTIPTGGGKNRDNGMEWIITRVHGQGYSRLLIMVMGGNRPPTRIYIDGEFVNSRWAMPLLDPVHWEVKAADGKLMIILDGKEIWSKQGNYTVTHAIMNGYPNRHSTGEWAQ